MADPVPSRQQRQAETRRRLLNAAAEAFAARGFHGASVAGIAASAGYTTGALYANFDSKEALFLALVDERLAEETADIEEALTGQDREEVRQRLADRVRRVVTELRGDGRTMALLSLEVLLYAARERPDLRRALAERLRASDARMRSLLEDWQRSLGVESHHSADDLALLASLLSEGATVRLLLDPELVDGDRAARLFRDLVLDPRPRGDPG